jgi:soluble lytic murein transglycosylase-like protein
MRDHTHRVAPRRRSKRPPLAGDAARKLRLLSLSEGLSFCVLLRRRRDPRLELELKCWLERARQESGLTEEDARLVAAAVAALEGAFQKPALHIIEQARRRLLATGSSSLSRSGRSRRRRDPTHSTGATGRLALVAAAALITACTGVMTARGDPVPTATRAHPAVKVARRPTAVPRQSRCPIPDRLRGAFVVAAKKANLPISLLVAVARAESHFDSSARSRAGAIGVLQLMPATARALGVDPNDPQANVVAGARYLRSLYSRFGSSELALAAYNAGPTSVSANAGELDTETRAYVAKVKRNWHSLRGCR